MNHDPSADTRFKPGNPGGPGRPRSRPLTDRIREVLDEPAELEKVVRKWLALVEAGDIQALRMLLERLEGKVTDRVEHEGSLTVVDSMRVIDQVERALRGRAGEDDGA